MTCSATSIMSVLLSIHTLQPQSLPLVSRIFSPHGHAPTVSTTSFSLFLSQLKYHLLSLLWMSLLEQSVLTTPHDLPYSLQSPHPHWQWPRLFVFTVGLPLSAHEEVTLLKSRTPVHPVDTTGAKQFVEIAQSPSWEQAFTTHLLNKYTKIS